MAGQARRASACHAPLLVYRMYGLTEEEIEIVEGRQ